MLSVHAINSTTLRVQIKRPRFQDDLARFKTAIAPEDRSYDYVREEWTVIHADRYKFIDWVFRALEAIRPARPNEIKLTQATLW
jgi:hypothetical protein